MHADAPARILLDQLNPDQVLDNEAKLVTPAIRISAFNTITSYVRTVRNSSGATAVQIVCKAAAAPANFPAINTAGLPGPHHK